MENRNRRENMRLVVEGNAVYEVDQECVNRGFNQEIENRQGETKLQNEGQRIQGVYRRQ